MQIPRCGQNPVTPVRGVQAHGDNRLGGLDENELVAQMTVSLPFAGVDRPQEQRCRIAVEVEIQKPTVGRDVLLGEIPQERTLAAPGFAEHRNVRRATSVAHRDVRPRYLSVRDAIPEIKTSPPRPCSAFPSAKAVPKRCNELFKEANHLDSNCEGACDRIGNKTEQRQKTQGLDLRGEHPGDRKGRTGSGLPDYRLKFVIRTSR